jgi:hypothetical protein
MPRMTRRRRKIVIGTYNCGCLYGPMLKRDRPEKCTEHGEDIHHEYEVTRFVKALPKEEDLVKYDSEELDEYGRDGTKKKAPTEKGDQERD